MYDDIKLKRSTYQQTYAKENGSNYDHIIR